MLQSPAILVTHCGTPSGLSTFSLSLEAQSWSLFSGCDYTSAEERGRISPLTCRLQPCSSYEWSWEGCSADSGSLGAHQDPVCFSPELLPCQLSPSLYSCVVLLHPSTPDWSKGGGINILVRPGGWEH